MSQVQDTTLSATTLRWLHLICDTLYAVCQKGLCLTERTFSFLKHFIADAKSTGT